MYIAADSVEAADRLADRLDDAVVMLSEFPEAGRNRAEFNPDLRSFPVDSYVIFYRVRETSLEVVRILSSFRDITPEMLSE